MTGRCRGEEVLTVNPSTCGEPKRRGINIAGLLMPLSLAVCLASCGGQEAASEEAYAATDAIYDAVAASAARFGVIAGIDHSRLAAQEGEVMPPARVVIFSNPAVNTPLLQLEPLTGLDLPYRVLVYAEGQAPSVLFTTADYLARRHGLDGGPALQQYDEEIRSVVAAAPASALVEFDTAALGRRQGIVTLTSIHDFDQTIERLKAAIMAESDTIWFGEIDYRAEAASLGVELPDLTLLLFGAPGPGGKAMAAHPRMGLDAFCQKVLVYQPPGEPVTVYFNDMAALAELHHGDSALAHRIITHRVRSTLGSSVEE